MKIFKLRWFEIRNRNRVVLATLAISFLLHMGSAVFLSRNFESPIRPKQKTSPADAAPLSKPIEILFTENSNTDNVPPQAARKSQPLNREILSGGFQKHALANILTADDGLVVGSNFQSKSTVEKFPRDPMTNVESAGHGWSGAVQYGNSMGLEFTLESLHFFQALHTRVNSQLVYPDDFSRQRLTGKVRIEAEVGKDGRLIRFLSSTADDRLLQTYCFSVLAQILSQPLPERSWLANDRSIVAFDFDFRTRIPDQPQAIFRSGIEKNLLAFGRENEIDPWLNEKLNELFTHYIPPIVPIPGGFYVDFVAAYKYVNNLIEGAPVESEQRRARLETLHNSLREMMRLYRAPQPKSSPEPISVKRMGS